MIWCELIIFNSLHPLCPLSPDLPITPPSVNTCFCLTLATASKAMQKCNELAWVINQWHRRMNHACNYTKKLWKGLEGGGSAAASLFSAWLLLARLYQTQLAVLIGVKHCNTFDVKEFSKNLWFACRNSSSSPIYRGWVGDQWPHDVEDTFKIGPDRWLTESDKACKTLLEYSPVILNPFISQGTVGSFPLISLHWCLRTNAVEHVCRSGRGEEEGTSSGTMNAKEITILLTADSFRHFTLINYQLWISQSSDTREAC